MIVTGFVGYMYTKRIKKRIVEKVANQIRPESEQYDDVLRSEMYGEGKVIDNDYDVINSNEEEEVRYAEAYQVTDDTPCRYAKADVYPSQMYSDNFGIQSSDDYWRIPAPQYFEMTNPKPLPRKIK